PNTELAVLGARGDAYIYSPIKRWLPRLWVELNNARPAHVFYENDERQVLRRRSTAPQAQSTPLGKGGTYLVLGGFGGVGGLFAEHLAKSYAANLILVGRSPLDEHKKAKLCALETAGGRAVYIDADICDGLKMREAIAQATKRFGPL